MKTVLIIWGAAIVYCIIEAYFFTELDPESKKFLDERDKLRNEKAKEE